MSSAPYDLGIRADLADALFASAVQRSDDPCRRQVRQATAAAIGAYGQLGCAARVAQAYGDHPETAVTRMRWARTAIADAFGGSQPQPAQADRLPASRNPGPEPIRARAGVDVPPGAGSRNEQKPDPARHHTNTCWQDRQKEM